METPSDKETPIEDQNDNAGADAAEAGAGGEGLQPDDSLAELPVGDLDATDPADDDAPEPTPEELAGDQAASDAEDREAQDEPELGRGGEGQGEVATTSPGVLPTYKCHKLVTAFLIGGAESLSNGRIKLTGVDPVHEIIVGADYVDKHRPQIGGYYVRYHDGYQSWSPAAAFESGYTLVD